MRSNCFSLFAKWELLLGFSEYGGIDQQGGVTQATVEHLNKTLTVFPVSKMRAVAIT